MKRREFLMHALGGGVAAAAIPSLLHIAAPSAEAAAAFAQSRFAGRKVIILGVDGVDPNLMEQWMAEGKLPNLRKLVERGHYRRLATTAPPHTPVAWANFIAGMDPGGHGIFDFLHRDPATMEPYLSSSRSWPVKTKISLGKWEIPLAGGKVELLRQGRAFWQDLEDAGVPTIIFRMPTNFPPSPSPGKSISSVGTPDILGTPGTFTFWTTKPLADADKVSGGRVIDIAIQDHRADLVIEGPSNPFRRERISVEGAADVEIHDDFIYPPMTINFRIYRDPVNKVAKIALPDEELLMNEGEWSDWVVLEFTGLPGMTALSAIARLYLKQVHPEFMLYMSPMQINPADPVMPICTPADWGRELVEALGYFYTQEFPENTKALTSGVFDTSEFATQAWMVYDEEKKFLDYFLGRFNEGLFFHYVSSTDQIPHMLWRNMDREHPGFEDLPEMAGGISKLYSQVDEAVGQILETADEKTVVIVMSDHGFNPYYYSVNLNTWLFRKGYVGMNDRANFDQYEFFSNVNWDQTRAYNLGLNAIYLNLAGREKWGIVKPEDYDKVCDQIERDLLAWRDVRRGDAPVVTNVTRPRRDFKGDLRDQGPDLIVGFNRTYRISWESPLGEFPKEIIVDNLEPWSGDHCIDPNHVPGILISTVPIALDDPAMHDVTVGVLGLFGVGPSAKMIGRNCFKA